MLVHAIRRGFHGAALMMAGAASLVSPAFAQDYPTQTIKVISTVSAGGTLDIIARAYAEELQKRWGQAAVVEPRPGGNFIIAARACASAPADGHTLCLMTGDPIVNNEFLYAKGKLPYDPRKDFLPVTNLFFNTMALVVNASLGVKTLDELAAFAKANPKTLNYMAPRVPEQVFFDQFNKQRGTDIVKVPFRGAGEAINLMVGGTVQVAFMGSSSFAPFVRQGTMVPLAVDGPSFLYPDAPTLDQLGYKEPHTRLWLGVFVPAGTPPAIVDKIHKTTVEILKEPTFRQRHLVERGLEAVGDTPEEFARYLDADRVATEEIIKRAGLVPQ